MHPKKLGLPQESHSGEQKAEACGQPEGELVAQGEIPQILTAGQSTLQEPLEPLNNGSVMGGTHLDQGG